MSVFRGVLEQGLVGLGSWILRGDAGSRYDLYFAHGGPPGSAVGKPVKVRGRVRKDMMGIGMGPVLEVEAVDEE